VLDEANVWFNVASQDEKELHSIDRRAESKVRRSKLTTSTTLALKPFT